MTESTNTTTTKRSPVARVQKGRISAAIWKQSTDKGTFYNFTLERSYKDANGEYQSSGSFALQDALLVAKIANLADSQIRKLLDADYAASRLQESEEEELA